MAQISISAAQAFNNTLSDAFNISYNQAIASADNWAGRVSKVVSTNTQVVNLPFILQAMGVKESIIGEHPDYFNTDSYMQQVPLKKWGNAARLQIAEFENPLYQGMLMDDVQALASELAFYPVIKICDILNNGNTSAYPVWDGQNYFSNSHVLPNGAAFDNLQAGALTPATFTAAISTLRSVSYGPYSRVLPTSGAKFYLIVPVGIEYEAKGLMFNQQLYQATYHTQNMYLNAAEVIVAPQLTNNGDWYLVASYQNQMPFVHLEHSTVLRQFIPRLNPESVNVSDLDNYEWVAKSYEEVVPGQFFMAIKSLA